MVENIRLDRFVDRPLDRIGEAIDFEREALRPRRQLPHHQREIGARNTGVAAQIGNHIGPQRADIGDPPRIDRIVVARQFMAVPLGDLLLLAREVVVEQAEALEPGDFFFA